MSRTNKDKPYYLRYIDDKIPVRHRTQVDYFLDEETNTSIINVHPSEPLLVGKEAKELIISEVKNQTFDIETGTFFFYNCSCSLCSNNTVEIKRAKRRKNSREENQQVVIANTTLRNGTEEELESSMIDDFMEKDNSEIVGFNSESVSAEDSEIQDEIGFTGSYETTTHAA